MTKSPPKSTLKIKPSVTALAGNSFTYFLPKSSSSQTAHVKTAGKNGVLEYRKPYSFIKTNFNKVTKLKIHSTGSLPPQRVLRGVDIVCAALEGGYGRHNLWTSGLAMKPAEASDLARYLLSRLALVASCLLRGANHALTVKPVYAHVETSEKAALSFIIGGIGSYIAAQNWLRTGGDRLDLFLHAGIYTKAVNGIGPLVNYSPSSKKSPDYLVYSGKKDWHVFESKGGSIDDRWLRIVQGLAQLANLPPIFWVGDSPKDVRTAVCVHTSVDANKALQITVVDPPSKNDEEKESASVGLIESVCKLLLVLEAIDQFRGLIDNSRTRRAQFGSTTWLLGDSTIFEEFIVGLPSRYFDNELRIRRAIGIYLAAAEAYSGSENVNEFAEKFREKLIAIRRLSGDISSVRVGWAISSYVSRVREFFDKPDFLLNTSLLLGMEDISKSLLISNREKFMIQSRPTRATLFTSGGMLISQRMPPHTQKEDDSYFNR